MSERHLRAGSVAAGGDPLLLTPERAGWRYAGLRVAALGPGEERVLETGSREMVVLPLSGSCEVEVDGVRWEVEGREGVFDRVSDFVYLPIGTRATLTSSAGGEFALPWSVAERRLEPAYGPAEEVAVEVRGAGPATRQITNFFTEEAFPADRLIAVEVLAPGGNWSSYPPHKHDDARAEGEVELEEIYYFRIEGSDGFGVHRTYAADGEFDDIVTVRDGDAFLVPKGYHGPCVAAPGYPMYYLNVLAGPGEGRALAYTDDPVHAWIRPSWQGVARDPRLPMTTAEGRRP